MIVGYSPPASAPGSARTPPPRAVCISADACPGLWGGRPVAVVPDLEFLREDALQTEACRAIRRLAPQGGREPAHEGRTMVQHGHGRSAVVCVRNVPLRLDRG